MIERATFETAGLALWNQRHRIKAALPRLEGMLDAILSEHHMVMLPEEYPKLYAIAREFQPDLILEVGRLLGNTTCVLTEAVQDLEGSSVLSICLTDMWFVRTLPKIKSLLSASWLEKLDARVMNFVELDVEKCFQGKQRVLFLLDAHGWLVAEYTLGVVLPQLLKLEHLVLVHDIIVPTHYSSEVRSKYFGSDASKTYVVESYGGSGIWKGESENPSQLIFVNGLAGQYVEFLALVDFAERNKLKLCSVEEDIRREIECRPERRSEMLSLLGERMYSPASAFVWIDLNRAERKSSLHFPRFEKPVTSARARLLEELTWDLSRHNNRGGHPSLWTFGRILAKTLLGRYRA